MRDICDTCGEYSDGCSCETARAQGYADGLADAEMVCREEQRRCYEEHERDDPGLLVGHHEGAKRCADAIAALAKEQRNA